MIDGLERRGLLARSADAGDRRVWRVGLTPEGADLVDRINDVDTALRQELRAGITKAERKQLADTLVNLQANLTRILEAS
jgi:DNA-binding MarR family transcriptional regulator